MHVQRRSNNALKLDRARNRENMQNQKQSSQAARDFHRAAYTYAPGIRKGDRGC